MKPSHKTSPLHLPSHCNLLGATALALSTLLATTGAQAASGTWTQIVSGTASGTWSDAQSGNWAGGVVAGGTDSTADFSTLDVSGTSTITLGEPRTIGNIIFGDTGTTTLSNWVLTGSGANTLTLSGAAPTITVNNLGNPSSSTTGFATISASISGNNGLVKNGDGTVATSGAHGRGVLVLSGSNNYSGGTTISSGALRAANNFALGTDAVTVASGAQLQLSGGINVANTINLNGANGLFAFGGSPTLSGIVNLQSNSGINLATNNGNPSMTLSGTIQLNGFVLSANTQNVPVIPAITLSGVISGSSGGITQTGNGRLLITNDNSATYSGTTTLNAGTLEVGNDGALGTGRFVFNPANDAAATIRTADTTSRTIAAAVTISGGNANSRFVFGAASGTNTGNLTFTNTSTITLGSGAKRFEVANRTTFNAGFAGTGSLVKQSTSGNGLGTLVLNGANTYTGATLVNAGTLLVNGSLSASSAVSVGTSTLVAKLGGIGTIGGVTTTGTNGVLTPGEDGIAGNLTFGSALNIETSVTNNTGSLLFDLGATSDMITLSSGVLSIGAGALEWNDFNFNTISGFTPGGSYTLFSTSQVINGTLGANLTGTIGGTEYAISFADGNTDIILTVVPEPSVCLLAGAGLMSMLFLRRRKI